MLALCSRDFVAHAAAILAQREREGEIEREINKLKYLWQLMGYDAISNVAIDCDGK